MQLIAADIGNSSIKIAVEHTVHDDRWCLETIFRADEPIRFGGAPGIEEEAIASERAFWAVSSVNEQQCQRLARWVAQTRPDDHFHVIQHADIQLKSNVVSRSRLGADRLIAAQEAVRLNEGGPLIVVDAGTAVTVDLVDADDCFQGGLIFPGARSSLKLLAEATDALPDLTEREVPSGHSGAELERLGKSTESAMWLGVYRSQIAAIEDAVASMGQMVANSGSSQASSSNDSHSGFVEVYVTGGGMQEILEWIPASWQFVPDLVLRGAKTIGRQLAGGQEILKENNGDRQLPGDE